MNRLFYLLALVASLSIGSASATVFRVDNNLAENITGGVFSALQRAHDHFSVKNGDTLMIASSGREYTDGLTCTKRLVLIGPGYFLGENNGVNSVVASAKIAGSIQFENGSQGSYLIGLESLYYVEVKVNNIYVIRSKLYNIYINRTSSCKITMSYIYQTSSYLAGGDISLTNSIIESESSNINFVTFENNIITGTNARYTSNPLTISAGTFRNNILIDRDAKVNIKSPNIQNNLAPNEQFGTTNGNRAYEAADLFVGGSSSDGKYRLKANSPYLTAGYGGTQPGIFGGSEPYTLSGVPPIPIIYELNVPGTGSAASGLQINVKIRGAN